jgi:hypothetical protein
MQSVDRFLTTHTGSLPRPDDLIEMVIATQRGDKVDPAALEDRITSAVFESTRRQVEAGVDIVNDGEMSKPSYATYVLQRLTGFGGSSNSFPFADLKEFPRVAGVPACSGPGDGRSRTEVPQDAGLQCTYRRLGLRCGEARHGPSERRGQRSWGEADVYRRGVARRHLLLLQE